MSPEEQKVIEAAITLGQAVRAYNVYVDEAPGGTKKYSSDEFHALSNAMEKAEEDLLEAVDPLLGEEG
jgi:hypothetical protein